MTISLLSEPEPPLWRRVLGLGWVSIWLVFLGSPLQQIWRHSTGPDLWLGTVCVFGFGLLYLCLFAYSRLGWRSAPDAGQRARPLVQRLMLLGLAALTVAAIPSAGATTLTMLVYIGAASMFTFRPNIGVAVVLGLAVLAEVAARLLAGWHGQEWSGSFAILFAGAAVYATRIAMRRNRDLAEARDEMAQMMVEEERSRMTRDLHDILGHSLTVITVKAQLAARLVGADDERAAVEVADIERLAREALTDVRATIAGRREVTLAPELINAKAALASANIVADVPNALDEIPAANRELFGWAVREGVTNVLRHSKASRCEIRLSQGSVEIHDDGVGCRADTNGGDGNGLRGLRERVAAAGASIFTGRSGPLGGFLLQVSTAAHLDEGGGRP